MKKRKHDLTPAEALSNDLTSEDPITVASSTECTGLVRTPAVTEAQAESYQDLYTVPVKENKQKDQIRP